MEIQRIGSEKDPCPGLDHNVNVNWLNPLNKGLEKRETSFGVHIVSVKSLVVGHFIQYKTRQGSASFELCVHTGQANQLETKSWADLNCVSTRVL